MCQGCYLLLDFSSPIIFYISLAGFISWCVPPGKWEMKAQVHNCMASNVPFNINLYTKKQEQQPLLCGVAEESDEDDSKLLRDVIAEKTRAAGRKRTRNEEENDKSSSSIGRRMSRFQSRLNANERKNERKREELKRKASLARNQKTRFVQMRR